MTMFTVDYWNERAKKFGHTGHSEPFYYCFDQQARLYGVDEIIKKLDSKKNTALDFGCGSGDFIELLTHYYKTIYGYDTSEIVLKQTRQRFEKKPIVLLDDLNTAVTEKKFDLILTVTVLQSLTYNELEKTLSLLSQLLSEGGVIVSMEFFVSKEHNLRTNETRTTKEEWLNLLAKNNLKIDSSRRFYGPVDFPSKSWLLYKKNVFLKLLRLFKNLSFIQKYFIKLAKKYDRHYFRKKQCLILQPPLTHNTLIILSLKRTCLLQNNR
jgi:SAM-dependent methyltransferase